MGLFSRHASAFAPVGTGVEARVLSGEMRPYAQDLVRFSHEFRVIDSYMRRPLRTMPDRQIGRLARSD